MILIIYHLFCHHSKFLCRDVPNAFNNAAAIPTRKFFLWFWFSNLCTPTLSVYTPLKLGDLAIVPCTWSHDWCEVLQRLEKAVLLKIKSLNVGHVARGSFFRIVEAAEYLIYWLCLEQLGLIAGPQPLPCISCAIEASLLLFLHRFPHLKWGQWWHLRSSFLTVYCALLRLLYGCVWWGGGCIHIHMHMRLLWKRNGWSYRNWFPNHEIQEDLMSVIYELKY